MSFVLSLDECVRVNASVLKAVQSEDFGTLLDILARLKASNVKGKLKVRSPFCFWTA
jgi:hypothetical protein